MVPWLLVGWQLLAIRTSDHLVQKLNGETHRPAQRSDEGSVIKRGSTYSVVLDLGRGPDGKRQRKWHSRYRTKKEAEKARIELLARVDQGAYVEPSRLTLTTFLPEQWLPSLTGQVRPTTLHAYRTTWSGTSCRPSAASPCSGSLPRT